MSVSLGFFNKEACEKINPCDVDAYISLSLDPENSTGVILDSPWGVTHLDLASVVKAGETVTSLELVPEDSPTAIRFMREDGDYDCITGDELSRIISMTKLGDVDQDTAIADGYVYMYDGDNNVFTPYDLQTFIGDTNTYIGRLQASITNLQNQIDALDARIDVIETKLTPPENAPDDVSVAFGNRNVYGDVTNTDLHDYGVFTHDPTEELVNDLYFS